MPRVGLVDVNLSLRSQKVERSHLEILERVHRPAIGAIGRGVVCHGLGPAAATAQQLAYVHAPRRCLLQRTHGRCQRHPRRRAHRGVLVFE